ncbi:MULTISPECIES: hypothetical protein [unclassified Janthinobacterium]|uniref:hypothetical protein n=1 Tax=unclassified Janthinobacterium TaxID=2610881 RepID=UPI000344DAC0|nr:MULTISPECIES: hypothetical protein [unclassified Janthinobacterium]MEC5162221.1 hypothetical protein [Janthinobacterium sp. CG_S6]
MPHIDTPDLNQASKAQHLQLAAEQSAMHAMHLALARWSNGYCQCEMLSGSPQSRWHAAAQNNFALWLAAGGFSQTEPERESAPETAPETAPADAAAPAAAPRRWRAKALPGTLAGACAA